MTVMSKSYSCAELFGAQTFHFYCGKCQGRFQSVPFFYASGKVVGDNERTAPAIAAAFRINDERAAALPKDKKALIDGLRAEGRKTAMAGVGPNDAPALAADDVGIAMGTGVDGAVETAAIALLSGNLMSNGRAGKLARATLSNIKQNLFCASVYNVIGVPVAAGVLFPLTDTLLTPMIDAAAMGLSSVSGISYALRLRRVEL